MIQTAFTAVRRVSSASLLLIAGLAPAQAGAVTTPEPSSYAIGFGGAALGFVVWRNLRRARNRDRKN